MRTPLFLAMTLPVQRGNCIRHNRLLFHSFAGLCKIFILTIAIRLMPASTTARLSLSNPFCKVATRDTKTINPWWLGTERFGWLMKQKYLMQRRAGFSAADLIKSGPIEVAASTLRLSQPGLHPRNASGSSRHLALPHELYLTLSKRRKQTLPQSTAKVNCHC